ncbi:MAG: filamentous hemagglutinin N-terminal domain-containing protein, partial [Leptothrix sp. (in: b-proteobacteria)]
MSRHASMNRIFRTVWNEVLGTWVAVQETARGRGKRSVRSTAALAPMLAALAMVSPSQAAPPGQPPAANTLPTGGVVKAGQAAINAGAGAVLNIDQGSQRAAIDWATFNLGSAAQVNFNQPNAAAATLNRVLDSNPSQIFGKITATGQVILSNPNGVLFGKSASVDVGGLTATTHAISDADFMAGKATYSRNGATGSVINEGELRAALGGYVALLAPEVRNEGVIVARMGMVALAAGEVIALQFAGNNTLAGITVQPGTLKALVENRGAVVVPGGLVVLSARSLDQLQGGVIRNSGRIEATGLSMKNGRIVLDASDRIENSGSLRADAGSDGSPAGQISLSAPVVVNSGTIAAVAAPAPVTLDPAVAAPAATPEAGGQITISAEQFTQAGAGLI